MDHIDAIFFDLDGTLVDSRDDIVSAVNYTLAQLGKEQRSYNEIISYVGTGVKDLIIKAAGSEHRFLVDRGVEIFTEYFSRHYADNSKLYPHVKDVLEFYKSKKMAVITNRRTEMTEDTLKKFEIDRYFQKIIGGDDDNCLKPSACPVEKGLTGILKDEEKALMVGDMDLDISAGKEAGIYTCGVTYGIGSRVDLKKADPDYLIDDIVQLKNLIV